MKAITKTARAAALLAAAAFAAAALAACATGAPAAFDEGDPSVPILAEWVLEDDSGMGGTSTIAMAETEEGGMPAWRFTGELTRAFEWGYVTFGFEDFDEETLELFGKASAVSFMVRGDGQQYVLQLLTSVVQDYGHFFFNFGTVAGEAVRVTAPMRAFFQPAWAASVGWFNAATMTGMRWTNHDDINPGSYDLTIWDVRLYVPGE